MPAKESTFKAKRIACILVYRMCFGLIYGWWCESGCRKSVGRKKGHAHSMEQSGCITSITLVYSLARNLYFISFFRWFVLRSLRLFNAVSSLSNVSYETRFVIIVYTKLVLFFFRYKNRMCIFRYLIKNVERETTMSSTAAAAAAVVAAAEKMVRIILMPGQ